MEQEESNIWNDVAQSYAEQLSSPKCKNCLYVFYNQTRDWLALAAGPNFVLTWFMLFFVCLLVLFGFFCRVGWFVLGFFLSPPIPRDNENVSAVLSTSRDLLWNSAVWSFSSTHSSTNFTYLNVSFDCQGDYEADSGKLDITQWFSKKPSLGCCRFWCDGRFYLINWGERFSCQKRGFEQRNSSHAKDGERGGGKRQSQVFLRQSGVFWVVVGWEQLGRKCYLTCIFKWDLNNWYNEGEYSVTGIIAWHSL